MSNRDTTEIGKKLQKCEICHVYARCQRKYGGGLMILYKNGNILMKKIETTHKDILIIQCQIYGLELRMILIYMSVSNYDTNKYLMKYIKDHIQNIKKYIILGDFNGHIGFLGPQPMNKNGELMLDLINNNNLILLKGHADCKGRRSWLVDHKREHRTPPTSKGHGSG